MFFKFDRPDTDHPIMQAARETNALADKVGLQQAITDLGMNLTLSEVNYMAQQRALRALASAMYNHNMGADPEKDETIAKKVVENTGIETMALVMSAYVDGFAIGWKANQIATTK